MQETIRTDPGDRPAPADEIRMRMEALEAYVREILIEAAPATPPRTRNGPRIRAPELPDASRRILERIRATSAACQAVAAERAGPEDLAVERMDAAERALEDHDFGEVVHGRTGWERDLDLLRTTVYLADDAPIFEIRFPPGSAEPLGASIVGPGLDKASIDDPFEP
jgi:hypothetical protein